MNALLRNQLIATLTYILEETLTVHGLMSSPGQLYNTDESGVSLNSCPPGHEDRKCSI